MRPVHELLSRAAWWLRPQSGMELQELKVTDGKYVVSSDGSMVRCIAFFRVEVQDVSEDPSWGYSAGLKTTLQQQRMHGLFEGLRRASVPFLYIMMMNRADTDEEEPPILEFDLAVGTWVDAKRKEEVATLLEQRANILAATLCVALPTANVVRLARKELADFVKSALLPGGRSLGQTGSTAIPGTLCAFDEQSPLATAVERAPEFYVPNASESGSTGILLGSVKSGSREYHDFNLQVDDLMKHVSILGSTGSGKSTTTATILRQVAESGLPTLVLDWHNEHGATVTAVGGKVVAPGKDDFRVNPLEAHPETDQAEHMATVSDIFSDIYHFTHPQAYMFRNALQKVLTETTHEETPTIATLVKTIEAYPLRSAYDNETKVALLRRLVPLTQGHSGRALGGSGLQRLEELLSTVVCIELGHMRDAQSRAMFTDVILKMIYEEKVKHKGSLDHLTIIEEARNVAPARKAEDPPSVGERMVSELRKFGEGMLFVAQFPSHVAAEVVKNCGTKIVHRLGWPDDVSLMGDSMGLSQKQREYLPRLRTGEAVVGVTRIQKPVLVQIRSDYVERSDLSLAPEP